MDPKQFDRLIRRYSDTLSRRVVTGGALGAALLALAGLDAANARRASRNDDVGAEACIPTGKKCPSPKPRGGRGGRHRKRRSGRSLGCDKCCQRRFITKANGKNICYCVPIGEICTDTRECCDGRCLNGVCALGGCTPPQTLCGNNTCVNLQSDPKNCGSCGRACPAGEVCNIGLACQASTCFPLTATTGDVSAAANGAVTATTQGASNFGNLVFGTIPAGTTFAQLATMTSDFSFSFGTCGASPRFVVELDNGRCPYALFSTGACAVQGNTGNLIGNDTPGLWNDDQCGGDPNNDTYSEVLAAYGASVVTRISLIVDESPAGTEQAVTLDPCITRA